MSWEGSPRVVVRHLLAEAIRSALTTKEPIGDGAAVDYNVVEALNRVAEALDHLAASIDRFRIGEEDR